MDDAKKLQVIEAIGTLLESNPDDKTPNVDVVSDLVGFKVSAAIRDEALKAFHAQAAEAEVDVEAEAEIEADVDAENDAEVDNSDAPVVKNNMAHSLNIFGVTIASKGSAPVPKFDPEKPVIATWLDGDFISVE